MNRFRPDIIHSHLKAADYIYFYRLFGRGTLFGCIRFILSRKLIPVSSGGCYTARYIIENTLN